ncbi:MAG: hypothetical protein EOO12_15355 [Chitinophagaceae bacterium]|nr:MAG: hypothetical protein EOO12_15355 [Chitinophagaceae bacterium]
MHQELLHLQAENRRLTAVVSALAEKNLRLEEELRAMRSTNTYHPNGDAGTNTSGFNLAVGDVGTNTEVFATAIEPAGSTKQFLNPAGQPARSTNRLFHPEAENAGTNPGVLDGFPGLSGSIFPVDTADSGFLSAPFRQQAERATAEAVRNERLTRLSVALPSWEAIAAHLRAGPVPHLRWPQERNLPLLLNALCRPGNERRAYPELQKMTQLSYTGLYKVLQAGIRAGLIHRAGWQRYQLTTAGISVLERAFQTHPPAPSQGEGG